MTDIQKLIERARGLLAEATTHEKWTVEDWFAKDFGLYGINPRIVLHSVEGDGGIIPAGIPRKADAVLIAAAPTLIAELCQALEEATTEIEQYMRALRDSRRRVTDLQSELDLERVAMSSDDAVAESDADKARELCDRYCECDEDSLCSDGQKVARALCDARREGAEWMREQAVELCRRRSENFGRPYNGSHSIEARACQYDIKMLPTEPEPEGE